MTTLITPITRAAEPPDSRAESAGRRVLPWTLWLALILAACGPTPRTSQIVPAATLTVAPPPVPKTLESTLRLDPGVEEIPFYPQIAESIHGDMVAVWEQFDGEHYNIWGNSSRAHQGWGRARLLQTSDTAHSYNPRVAINANGQAAAVWVQMRSGGGSYAIWSSRLEPGADWGEAMPVEPDNAGPTYAPHVAIDDRGHAVVAWQQSDGRRVNVRASRFVPGAGWGKASHLEHGGGDLGAPWAAVDAAGNAMVVWPRFHLSRTDLWASRYTVGGAWDKALRIDAVPGYVHTPLVMTAAGSPGQFTVLWEQQEGFRTGVGASHYQPRRGWRAAGNECAAQLQALATSGPAPGSWGAGGKASNASRTTKADICY